MDRYHLIAKCMDIWMNLREKNYTINTYFKQKNIHKIGVYGYGILGRHLIWETEQSETKVAWILDKRANSITTAYYPVYLPDGVEKIEEPDVIVVCAVNDFAKIEAFICEKTRVPVVSLEYIIRTCDRQLQMGIEV